MDAFFTGLSNLINLQVVVAIFIGAVGGVMIGAIPGIGPAIAFAISPENQMPPSAINGTSLDCTFSLIDKIAVI